MDYVATSLYPSAMLDVNSVYLGIESGYNFESHMNDLFVNVF